MRDHVPPVLIPHENGDNSGLFAIRIFFSVFAEGMVATMCLQG